jgi:hypothetical protein
MSKGSRATLELCCRLYAARCVEADLAWFLGERLLPLEVGGRTGVDCRLAAMLGWSGVQGHLRV